jgi:hypothetical protein
VLDQTKPHPHGLHFEININIIPSSAPMHHHHHQNIVTCVLKAIIVKPAEKLLLGNGSADTPVASQWLSRRHVMAAAHMYATMEELLEVVFSVQSLPSLYNEDQLSLRMSPEMAVRSAGG